MEKVNRSKERLKKCLKPLTKCQQLSITGMTRLELAASYVTGHVMVVDGGLLA